MIVKQERPPLYAEIDMKFHVAHRRGVLYTFGDAIYNPDGVDIPPALMEHEEVHSARQLAYPGIAGLSCDAATRVEAWWKRYLDDDAFRLAEELPAHRAEYQAICRDTRDRNQRDKWARVIAARLASSLYGNVIAMSEAMRRVRAA